jgi:hypothetical protein
MSGGSAKESIEARLNRHEQQNRYLMDYIAIWKVLGQI